MLLAKSCHDLDWISYITGERIEQVASFGGLKHFRPENAPAGAAERCLDCAVEDGCPYSALKLYVPTLREHGSVWPVTHVTDSTDETELLTALHQGVLEQPLWSTFLDRLRVRTGARRYGAASTRGAPGSRCKGIRFRGVTIW